ncbi:MAG: alanine--glyoxylate aminotransferase family protein [Sulfolobales archaeon]|nr:alanine--glyoxylate aminotransferase family protein [Sulfolobales archaeon]
MVISLPRFFTDRFILTPGPTEIPMRIRIAMIREETNPDLDPGFLELYKRVSDKLKRLLGIGKSNLYTMVGEAMLGLEAAIANIVRRGDKVLVVSNGVFGEGFADLVKMYGGVPVIIEGDWRRSIDLGNVERALERNKDARMLTIVHCDTPSAIINPVEEVSRIARSFGIITVVDAVSSIGGVPINVDGPGIDILIGGSQKALNVPPGLTIMSISNHAWEEIDRSNYQGFYLNLRLWREYLDKQGIFPYTFSDPLLRALDEALNMIFEEGVENVYERHRKAREASWRALEAAGLKPYPVSREHSSPTVTAIEIPTGVDEARLREIMWNKYGVMIAGSWGKLAGKVIRIGHMGVQASRNHLIIAFTALARALRDMGYRINIGSVIEAIESTYT